MLLEYANGTRRFTRGALLGALSVDLRIPVPIELIESLEMTASQPGTAYSPRRLPYVNYAEGLMPVEIPPLSLAEAASIFEMWGGASVLHTRKSESTHVRSR
jgi:small subunit ribosomal protein S29